ncbi:hypothetical protein GCM10023259_093620 [Thermocatellispora tengchongensis]
MGTGDGVGVGSPAAADPPVEAAADNPEAPVACAEEEKATTAARARAPTDTTVRKDFFLPFRMADPIVG